jgi:hypothetical protein
MRDEDKLFVLYRKSPMNFNVSPRGLKGWIQLGIWIALLVPPTFALARYAHLHEGRPELTVAITLYALYILVWTLGGIAWIRARAEIVDLHTLRMRKKEEERAQKDRRRRR